MPNFESLIPFILVNLLFAGVALAIGFLAGAWFLGGGKDRRAESAEERRKRTLEFERSAMASGRLRDLAHGMASDVGEHSSRVHKITENLQSLDLSDIEATGAGIVSALSEIVTANDTLQQRLAKAEAQIKAQAEEIRGYELEARTDSLTGLSNRRAFDDELKRRYSEWERKATTFSLMLVDIDHFKEFNDNFGHQAGDEVLRRVGKNLADACREMDLPCRYGGEEFAVVMPATLAADGKTCAERVRQAIEQMTVDFEGKSLKVTCSIGLAQVIRSDDTVRILKRADEALYQSKTAGRNCGHLHDGQFSVPFSPGLGEATPSQIPPGAERVATQMLETLPNRTRFADELRRRISESHRTGDPIAVVVVGVAGFDEIKKVYGPTIGCLTLDAVAQYLSGTMREMDLVARISESVFAVMLPGATLVEATLAAERTNKSLQGRSIPNVGDDLDLHIRIGMSELNASDTVETMVGRAEAMLAGADKTAAPEHAMQ